MSQLYCTHPACSKMRTEHKFLVTSKKMMISTQLLQKWWGHWIHTCHNGKWCGEKLSTLFLANLYLLEHPHKWIQNFFDFTCLKPTFSILYIYFFKKNSYQFIYSTHLFKKIFILLHFLLFSHSWPLSLSDPTTVIIT